MDIPDGKIEAKGLIKHVSKLKRIPAGRIRVLSPMGLRGLEVEFKIEAVDIPADDRLVLESGMTLRFRIRGDSRNGFTADELQPVQCAEYNGSVIKVPSPLDPNSKTIVSLDLTLNPVVLSSNSLKNLERKSSQPLACGDYVRLTIRWDNWIKALHAKARPEFDIVQVLERAKVRPRALSQGREEKRTDQGSRVLRVNDEVSSEELSPQHERLTRQREMTQSSQRRRSRSVGYAAPYENEIIPPEYYPYMPPQRFPYQYPVMTPEMMYGTFANFYNQSSMWMTPNFMPPFMQRGAQ